MFPPGNEADGEDNRSTGGSRRKQAAGFTLKELLVVTFIIALLVSLSFPLYHSIINKAEQAACAANMRTLFVAFSSHCTTHDNVWPQPPAAVMADEDKHMEWWVKVFDQPPYDIPEETWICPTYKRLEAGKEGWKRKSSYIPALFPPSRGAPYRYKNQPWLMHIGDPHETGGLILLPDGGVKPHPLLKLE